MGQNINNQSTPISLSKTRNVFKKDKRRRIKKKEENITQG